MQRRYTFGFSTVVAIIVFVGSVVAQTSTNPAAFTSVAEITSSNHAIPISAGTAEVDNQSSIRIEFDSAKIAPPASNVPGGPPQPQVQIHIEAIAHMGSSIIPIAPIDGWVEQVSATPTAGASGATESTGSGSVTYVYHDKFFDPPISPPSLPSAEINLRGTAAASADFIELKIENLETLESMDVTLIPRAFGFRIGPSDSLMFIKRLDVKQGDLASGIDGVNFSPTPGVTYGGVYVPRGAGLGRLLSPGIGMNMEFMDWSDPAFNVATGQFASGTKATSIQFGMGFEGSLFSGILQFTYGWNLNVQTKRQYIGVGMSFVNLATKVAGIIGSTTGTTRP